MAVIASKQRVLDRLHEERANWESLLAEMSEERMDEPGAMGDWTMKDTIAHLTNWWRWHLARAAGELRGERPPDHPPQSIVPLINDWLTLVNRDRSPSDVLLDARAVWDQMEELIRRAPEASFQTTGQVEGGSGPELGPLIVERFVKHLHDEHEADIRRWIERGRRSAAA